MDTQLPTARDIVAAHARLKDYAIVTPLLRSPELDAKVGGTVLLKAETLQRTGSFKFRGAFNRLAQLSAAERRAGVVAWSSGNHAQGVAAAGALLGIRTTIVMPADAPAIKLAATRGYGAEVVTFDRARESREEIGRRIAAERGGAVIVPPYDDPHIVAGQGTVGLEIADQAKAMGLGVDAVIAPASGGGLMAGVVLAVQDAFPSALGYCAEPEHYDDHRRSLATGSPQTNPSVVTALCDALLAPTPGALTWAVNGSRLKGGYAVSDCDVKEAMKFAFRALKLVVEPSGATALAAVLSGAHDGRGKVTAVVLSGGNVDSATFSACIAP